MDNKKWESDEWHAFMIENVNKLIPFWYIHSTKLIIIYEWDVIYITSFNHIAS